MTFDEIFLNYINGNKKDFVKMINDYGLEKFTGELSDQVEHDKILSKCAFKMLATYNIIQAN